MGPSTPKSSAHRSPPRTRRTPHSLAQPVCNLSTAPECGRTANDATHCHRRDRQKPGCRRCRDPGAREGFRCACCSRGPAVEVGRDCRGLLLTDPQISRRHLSLQETAGGVRVTDLGSRNGTRVDGAPIDGVHVLAPGQVVQFGATTIALWNDAPAGPTSDAGQTSIEHVLASVTTDPPDFAALPTDAGTLTIVLCDIEGSALPRGGPRRRGLGRSVGHPPVHRPPPAHPPPRRRGQGTRGRVPARLPRRRRAR